MSSSSSSSSTSSSSLGKGEYGIVHKQADTQTGRVLAIKTMITRRAGIARAANREVTAYQQLPPHPNLVTYIDVTAHTDKTELTLEYAGVSMTTMCTAPVARSTCIDVFRQICAGVAHMHEYGFAHRDLKPANVLVLDTKDGPHIRIGDLGFARNLAHYVRHWTPVVQSLWYRAPEVLAGDPYGLAVDMWSLGCILFELACGHTLFTSPTELTMLAAIADEFGPFYHHPLLGAPASAPSHPPPPPHELHRLVRESQAVLGPALYSLLLRLLDPNPQSRIRAEEAMAAVTRIQHLNVH